MYSVWQRLLYTTFVLLFLNPVVILVLGAGLFANSVPNLTAEMAAQLSVALAAGVLAYTVLWQYLRGRFIRLDNECTKAMGW